MRLTLVRHGDAGSPLHGLGDAGRCLSAHGRAQALTTGRALAEQGVAPTHAWVSPLVRAVQTMELILAELRQAKGVEVWAEARRDLYPDSHVTDLLAALRELPAEAEVLAVGHMPYMAIATGELLGIHVGGLSTAEAYGLDLDPAAPGRAKLRFRVRP